MDRWKLDEIRERLGPDPSKRTATSSNVFDDARALLDEVARLAAELERLKQYEILLFMTVRMKVMSVGDQLGKSDVEIRAMTLDTIEEMKKMIDYERANEVYRQALEERRGRST